MHKQRRIDRFFFGGKESEPMTQRDNYSRVSVNIQRSEGAMYLADRMHDRCTEKNLTRAFFTDCPYQLNARVRE